jgi:hypothetical protein
VNKKVSLPIFKKQRRTDIYEPREQIQFGIKTAAYAFEEKDTEDHIDEIAFEADVVAAHHTQDFVQDIADLDISEGESAALDAENQMLHTEGKDLFIDDCGGLATTFYHQVTCFVAVEFCNGFEKVEEVAAVEAVQFGDETGVDED